MPHLPHSHGGEHEARSPCLTLLTHTLLCDVVLPADYKPDGSSESVNATKFVSLHRLPEVLVLHLKRFQYMSQYASKLNKVISYDSLLRLKRPLVSDDCPDVAGGGADYKLIATVSHHGRNITGASRGLVMTHAHCYENFTTRQGWGRARDPAQLSTAAYCSTTCSIPLMWQQRVNGAWQGRVRVCGCVGGGGACCHSAAGLT